MNTEKRFPELDALRGIAVLMMIIYHIAYDLAFFYEWDIPVKSGSWQLLQLIIGTLFLMLVGICFTISWERSAGRYEKYFRRGLIIFSGGLLVSLFTAFLTPAAFVKFGILHLIGISAFLQPFFAPLKKWNGILGILIIILGHNFTTGTVDSQYLFPLGFMYPGFQSLDYYPLLPWFGVILIGMAIGNLLYVPRRRLTLQKLDIIPYPRWLLATGKNALTLYFFHQPVILITLAALFASPLVQ